MEQVNNIERHLIDHANQEKLIKVTLHKVANGKQTRYFDFTTIINGNEINLNRFISEKLGLNISKARGLQGTLIVNGCGMDMAFDTLYRLYSLLGFSCPKACESYDYEPMF